MTETKKRFSEAEKKSHVTKEFVIRERRPPLWQLLVLFAVGLFTIIQLVYSFDNIGHNPTLILCIFVIIGFLTWFTVFYTQRSRDLVMATEFQNALFANAAALHTRFCLITKKDGTIIYYDPGFQLMFPDFLRMEQRAIDVLLQQGGASDTDIGKISKALESGAYEKLVISLTTAEGITNKIVLSVDPLPRPQGFFLFRGREFIEQRSAGNIPILGASDMGRSLSAMPPIVGHMLHTMPWGLFIASVNGTLEFINHTLEQWLGYEENEIISRRLSVQDIIYQMDDKKSGKVELADFEGEVQMQKKTGALMKVHMKQDLLRDSNQQVLGCTATIFLGGDGSSSSKKKLIA